MGCGVASYEIPIETPIQLKRYLATSARLDLLRSGLRRDDQVGACPSPSRAPPLQKQSK